MLQMKSLNAVIGQFRTLRVHTETTDSGRSDNLDRGEIRPIA